VKASLKTLLVLFCPCLKAAGNHDRIVEALGPVRAAELFSTAGAVYLHPEPQLNFWIPDLQP